MAYVFGPVQPVLMPRFGGIEIVDTRTLPRERERVIRDLWHDGMRSFLQGEPTFTFQDTCVNEQLCLGPLNNAYIDHVEAERAAGREPMTYAEFSEANAATLLPDFISLPHLGTHWFGIRRQGNARWDGALVISNVRRIPRLSDEGAIACAGWPVVVHPARGPATQAEIAGAVIRRIMNANLIPVNPARREVDFVRWRLPRDPASRYIVRGSNTYGRDVFEEMADGVRVRFDDTDTDVPTEVVRELEPDDDPNLYPRYTRSVAEATSAAPLDGGSSPSQQG